MFVSSAFTQNTVAKPNEISKFYKSKTLVVKSNSPLAWFNGKIKGTMEKSWKATPYEIIKSYDFDDKRMDSTYSFLSIDQMTFTKDKSRAHYDFLCLSLGGDYKNFSDMPNLCSIPLSYSEVDDDTYIYKLNTFLKLIQNHVEITKNNKSLNKFNIIRYYNKNTSSIKNKTLYLVDDELSKEVDNKDKISKIYPFTFKIITRDNLEKIIDSEEKDAVFLHKVGPAATSKKGRCYKIIIGADDAKIYYYNFHNISSKNPDSILIKDFKKLAKK